jgi:N-acyl homoserine lactone hydrolase
VAALGHRGSGNCAQRPKGWSTLPTLVSTPGHTPGHQSLLIHLRKSGFIILSGDVAHLEENFEKNIVPSLNTDQAQSIASMARVRQLIATYHATFFINHDKSQTDKLKLLPAFYD